MENINKFTIGSDPEFVMVRRSDHAKMPAADLGLKPGLSAGADQNLRLAELRPKESYSVVTHVAGILAALRWLCVASPETLAYRWRCGAFYAGDGIGGHIHFGKSEPNILEDIKILDSVAKVLKAVPMFPRREWDSRMTGDAYSGKAYGKPGDYRLQKHGFEYRSLPSWLGSPRQAFIVIASCKLAMLRREEILQWTARSWRSKDALEVLREVSDQYRDCDEDAEILTSLLAQNFSGISDWTNGTWDFKRKWGLHQAIAPTCDGIHVTLPRSIVPASEEVEEIRAHLRTGKPLNFRVYPGSFQLTTPPGYQRVIDDAQLRPQIGIGDVIHDVLCLEDMPIQFRCSNCVFVSEDLAQLWNENSKEKMESVLNREVLISQKYSRTIGLDRKSCSNESIDALRRVLLDEKLFSLWRLEKVAEEAHSAYF